MSLLDAARQEMIDRGFDPDFPPGVEQQIAAIRARPIPDTGHDFRTLLWSSIDNDTSRDLDQIEVAERVKDGIRVRVGVADVSGSVEKGSPIDRHAANQTTTVYTGVKNFSMLPDELSTDLTSLNENQDRAAVVVEYIVAPDGSMGSPSIYRALVRNHAQLAYNGVGPWLEGKAAVPEKVAASPELQAQLKLQDEAAQALCEARHRVGALDFDRIEAEAIVSNGDVKEIRARKRNRATQLIEDFMIAANEVMAQTLSKAGVSSIRRIVKDPERWPRIVSLASGYGYKLPSEPDSAALNGFLKKMRDSDSVHYADISLAVIKLMGPGEYVMSPAGQPPPGHFALAVHDYTHSTAPNRRFADLVTQRLIKCVLDKGPTPYSNGELDSIALNCTQKEDAARKVERMMGKRLAAVALAHRIGETFHGVVTGVTPSGTFVRVTNPPAEGILIQPHGVDVGDEIRVKLLSTDPRRGYIDFARA
ncbi:MAG TPA: RNB domain-containing ribonuclease [Bryobacteraceae bacterium]|jgi:exoribonuclease-2|nr:RNB domain-containing ribonuclease [Bryobacteraceae bacterium]